MLTRTRVEPSDVDELRDALCTRLPYVEAAELFFGGGGPHTLTAKMFCGACPAREACLRLAMAAEGDVSSAHRYGIYGGCTPQERAHLARTVERAS